MVRRFLLQDCDESTSDDAVSRLARQSLTPFTQSPREIARRQKPTTYFLCTEDLATPADTQRRRVGDDARTIGFSAGHHPFLSRPEAFADSITAEIEAFRPASSGPMEGPLLRGRRGSHKLTTASG